MGLTRCYKAEVFFTFIFMYMDDIITVGGSCAKFTKFGVMLQTLRENNPTCNPSKSNFSFSEIEYLRHRISSNGIRISERRLKRLEVLIHLLVENH